MGKSLVPSSYVRKVVGVGFERRGLQRTAIGSHVLTLSCGHIKYFQGTLRVPRKTRCVDCWMQDDSPTGTKVSKLTKRSTVVTTVRPGRRRI